MTLNDKLSPLDAALSDTIIDSMLDDDRRDDSWDGAYDDDDGEPSLYDRWEAEEEARREGRVLDMIEDSVRARLQTLKSSQGIVRILGSDALRLGMTCDIEHGVRRQVVEVEIVDIHSTDKRLATVERTDGKKWDHDKAHTRIVRP